MPRKSSAIPDFTSPATKRTLILGALGTGLGVVVVIPLYNKILAPTANRVVTAARNAGFLPSA